MASKAKKLPSGNWRVQVYYKGNDGKNHFKSFTAPVKKDAEYMAAQFEQEKERISDVANLTLKEAIEKYIELKRPILSPTTIRGYELTSKRSFQSLMPIPIGKITSDMLSKAVIEEMNRETQHGGTPTPKSVKNAYGLVSAALSRFMPDRVYRVDMPRIARQIRTLPSPKEIYTAVKGEDIELAVLLAMWLSLSQSEVRGLTKSKSIDGDYLTIREVKVHVNHQDVMKHLAKTDTRTRRHRIPPYLQELISQVDGDVIVPYHPSYLLKKLKRCLRNHGVDEITFHDLRHVSASVMAALRIPDKYAQERGGWASDNVMKRVYMETFSEEREKADEKIDNYFSESLGLSRP